MSGTKTYFIKNLGCSKNKTDGSAIEDAFLRHGYALSDSPDRADIVIVNTCGFIQSARQQSIEAFFELNSIRRKGSKIVLCGCLAQMFHDQIASELREADAIIGNFDISGFDSFLESMEEDAGRKGISNGDAGCVKFGVGPNEADEQLRSAHCQPNILTAAVADSPVSVYLKIAEGCDHFCAFCSIPLIRGRFKSFDKGAILESMRQAVAAGACEINLIAQDLLSYGKDSGGKAVVGGFLELLACMAEIPGDFKIRSLYMHPDNFDIEIARFVKKHSDRFLPYFDLAFQHGSDRILKAMARAHCADYYAKMVESIRDVLPGSIIRSTFMLGFPGETKSTIKELETFVKRVRLEYCGFFRYSREAGTKAFALKPSYLSGKYLDDEISRIREICDVISFERLSRFVGGVFRAIVEEDIGDGVFLCRLPFQAPEVDGICEVRTAGCDAAGAKLKVGDIVSVRTAGIENDYDFTAEPV
ncbi:MAG TPA: hypothetical protein DCO86_02360 [Spirochaetaceae bacterium]|nr:hypothetical protein [Spirochaetaceae bacterium]